MTEMDTALLRRELDVDDLIAKARRTAGLVDFGNEGFVLPLRRFVECCVEEVDFHERGLHEVKEEIVRILVNRLRFQDDVKRHPEILDEDVSDPIIVIGLPRSGTTKTHQMMGQDQNLYKTYMWMLLNPAPFPGAVPGQEDPRIAGANNLDSLTDNPALAAASYYTPDQIEEDFALFALTFNSWWSAARTFSPSFATWAMEQRTEPSDLENYEYVRSLIQYLQWQQGGRAGKRWLLKHTGHLGHMDELLTCYPNATLVHIHRHPRFAVPSLASLMHPMCSARSHVDKVALGKQVVRWEKWWVDRYMESRPRLGLDDRILDVRYDDIKTDPIPVFRQIYERAGMEYAVEAEGAQRQWEADNPQHKHGRHSYTAEEFGMSNEIIDEAFAGYIARYHALVDA